MPRVECCKAGLQPRPDESRDQLNKVLAYIVKHDGGERIIEIFCKTLEAMPGRSMV